MSNKKLIPPIVLVLAIILAGTYIVYGDDSTREYDDGVFGYTIQGGSATIDSYHGYDDDLVIPSYVICDGERFQVRAIGDNVFRNKVFQDIIIPNGCLRIGEGTFDGIVADTVYIPTTVGDMGSTAFKRASVTAFEVSSANRAYTSVDGVLFTKDMHTLITYNVKSDRTSYDVPEGVVEIYPSAFSRAYLLDTITLPSSSVKVNGDSLFAPNISAVGISPDHPYFTVVDGVLFTKDMTGLVFHPIRAHDVEYTVPEGVESLGDFSFQASPLSSVVLPSTLRSIGDGAFSYSGLQSLSIPEGVERIGDLAFTSSILLTDVGFPSTLRSIGIYAFDDTSITEVELGPALEHLAASAFDNCYHNTMFSISPDNEFYTSIDGVLFTKDMTALLNYPSSRGEGIYTVPEGVQVLTKHSMAYSDIDVLVLPSTLKAIEDSALMWSTVSDVTFNEGLETIGTDAFTNCVNLTDPRFPSTLRTIGDGAYNKCSSIVIADLGDNLVSCKNSFNECESLREVRIPASLEEFECIRKAPSLEAIHVADGNLFLKDVDGILFSIDGDALIKYPAARPDTSFIVPEGVEVIEHSAFMQARNLESITLPSTLEYVYGSAFRNCTSLESITLPDNVVDVGSMAFDNCSSLKQVTFGASLALIADYAFNTCNALESIVFTGDAVPRIGNGAFNIGNYTLQVVCQVTSQFEEGFLEGYHGQYVTFVYL